MRLGPSAAAVDFMVFVFARCRDASQRVFWSLPNLYKALGMTTYNNVPSKWCFAVMQTSAKVMKKIFPFERFLVS